MQPMNRIRSLLSFASSVCWLACVFSATQLAAAEAEVCAICGKPFDGVYYGFEDKVTLQKPHVCKDCEQSFPECFVCSLPADTNAPGFLRLPDQRVLCTRDAKTAVLREEEGLRIWREVRDGVDRLFSRFTTFPDTNVTAGLVDRVRLLDLFKFAGNDYHCPNVWGFTQTTTSGYRPKYSISLMTGLPLSWFQATCAHEYAHTWIGEHLSPARKMTLSQDAQEGFCELVSYLFMQSLGDQAQLALILRNGYTRGQIDLFVAADRTFGFNEVLDWMQFGTDDALSPLDPGRVRKIAPQRPALPSTLTLTAPRTVRAPALESLMLKAIFWDQKRPTALINDRTFSPNEEGTVRVGPSNVLVRCLGISPDAVQLRIIGSDHDQTLRLK